MAQLMLVNPRKRRTTRKRRAPRRAPSRRLATTVTRKTYRRNPIKRKGIMTTFTNGATGAAGALAVDLAMSKLPIPANLNTGALAPVTRGLVGIGLGMLVAKFGKNKKLGEQLADGAVTVALYNTGKTMFGAQLGLADGELLGADSLLYYGDESDGMDYYSAAPAYDSFNENF